MDQTTELQRIVKLLEAAIKKTRKLIRQANARQSPPLVVRSDIVPPPKRGKYGFAEMHAGQSVLCEDAKEGHRIRSAMAMYFMRHKQRNLDVACETTSKGTRIWLFERKWNET